MTTSYSQINSLADFGIIGGSDVTLKFTIYDNGAAADLTGGSGTLKISPYGKPDTVITTLTGVITLPNIITFALPSATTLSMSANKYMYQPIIVDSVPKTYRPAQGTFTLVQGIG